MDGFCEILKEYGIDFADAQIKKMGHGHINDTFLLEVGHNKYTLQRINTDVFKKPEEVMYNIVAVTDHIAKKATTVRPIPTVDGKYLVTDKSGTFRLMTYIEGEVKEKIDSPSDMEAVGKGFGNFQAYLKDFGGELYTTIPDFHNTPVRYDRLISVAKEKNSDKNNDLLNSFVALKDLSNIIQKPLSEGKIPYRITHNDTKINNLVMKNGNPVCAIDLDTVMKGSLCCDFGDALRSGGTTASEDAPIEEVKFEMEFFEGFCKGFFDCGLDITEREKRLLVLSPAVLSYECGMRFLTDYLEGDIYFGAKYPEQNLLRAKNQLALAEDILAKTDKIEEIIDGFFY